jgi:hypothetical protein
MFTQGVPIWFTNRKMIKEIRSRLRPDVLGYKHRDARHDLYKKCLEEHQYNKQIYNEFIARKVKGDDMISFIESIAEA